MCGLFDGDKDEGGIVMVCVSMDAVMIDSVVGAKRFSNYFWVGVVIVGSMGFLFIGVLVYLYYNLVFFFDVMDIKFFL